MKTATLSDDRFHRYFLFCNTQSFHHRFLRHFVIADNRHKSGNKNQRNHAQENREQGIVIGNDVWIGYEAVILAGVTVGDGAIIGTRAVVTKDVPPYTIVAGIPAKPIRKRFSEDTIATLLQLRWWDWSEERIRANLDAIQSGQLDQIR